MTDPEVNGLFLLLGACVTGVTTIIASRSGAQIGQIKTENAQLKRQISRLLHQVEAYHFLEDEYAADLASDRHGKAAKTIKTEYRNAVVEKHQCERPDMTANEAKKRLKEIN